MWPFKKEEKLTFPKVIIYKVPKEEIPIFLKKYDETYNPSRGMVAVFEFWKYIYQLFPEIDKTQSWEIVFQNHERIEIVNTLAIWYE
jgi:hypothetical protein